MLNDILRNWRTSGAGIILGLAGLFRIFYPTKSEIIQRIAEAIIVLAGAVIALLAKDANISGTSGNPNP
jgi:uncharacterized membrane protein HdeD (DUF308 family)